MFGREDGRTPGAGRVQLRYLQWWWSHSAAGSQLETYEAASGAERTSFDAKDEKGYCCLIIEPWCPPLQQCVSVGGGSGGGVSCVIYVHTRLMF